MSIVSVMPSNHLILCHPLLLLPSIFPSIRVFSNESALRIKYWSFSFNISPSNEHPGLISFRMDWLDLLAVQGTLTSLTVNFDLCLLSLRRLGALRCPGHSPESDARQKTRTIAGFILFLKRNFAVLSGISLVLPFVQHLKEVISYIFSSFIVADDRRPTVIPVPSSWLQVKFICSTLF